MSSARAASGSASVMVMVTSSSKRMIVTRPSTGSSVLGRSLITCQPMASSSTSWRTIGALFSAGDDGLVDDGGGDAAPCRFFTCDRRGALGYFWRVLDGCVIGG